MDGETLRDVNIQSVQKIIDKFLSRDLCIDNDKDRRFVISQMKNLVAKKSKPNEIHGGITFFGLDDQILTVHVEGRKGVHSPKRISL